MRIALFATCLADTMFPAAAKATVLLLERLGHEVVFPAEQTCCGQMHINTGYQKDALPLVRRHIQTFEPYDVIVAPSGSCVGSVRHQHAMVAGADTRLAARATAVAARTYELSELLIDVLGVEEDVPVVDPVCVPVPVDVPSVVPVEDVEPVVSLLPLVVLLPPPGAALSSGTVSAGGAPGTSSGETCEPPQPAAVSAATARKAAMAGRRGRRRRSGRIGLSGAGRPCDGRSAGSRSGPSA